jgi:peptidoglycan/xylan/chitin deacetylase (PgdA/CDA1 family)
MNVPLVVQKFFGSLTWRMPAKDAALFITFDDGPVPGVTPEVLGILQDFRVKATFFCIGENVQKHPALYEKILAAGHATGNHTFHHLDGWKTKTKEYLLDIERCEQVLKSSNPHSAFRNSKPLFRPPYGKIKLSQISALKSQFSIIMWDVLSRDYDERLTGEQCFLNVRDHATKGSIVVFHDSEKAKTRVLHALPKVLQYFSERNYSFKTIC